MSDSKDEALATRARTTIGKNIRQYRLDKGMTQVELSEAAGINRAYLSTVENGKRNISVENIFALADALEIDPRDLVAPLPDEA